MSVSDLQTSAKALALELTGGKQTAPMNRASAFLTLGNIQRARQSLKTDGYLLIENGYSHDHCQYFIKFIDDHKLDEKTEFNYAGTEMRIWDAQKRDPFLNDFFQECNIFISCLLGKDSEAFTLLAMRNRALEAGDEPSKMGRWHLDSFKKQFKIFLFLTDTTELSGPFEFLPNTFIRSFKIAKLCEGTYVKPRDLLGGKRTYQKLDDAWVDGLSMKGYRPVPVLCKAGTIMVIDTSAIHRARPCLNGSRYLLMAYYK